MDSHDLTYDQCRQIQDRITECWKYVRELCERMQKRHFPYDDPIRQNAQRAFDALDSLRIALHYLSCDIKAGCEISTSSASATGFRLQVAFSEQPLCPPDKMNWVDAETPLEAIAKLARSGNLRAPDSCEFHLRILLPEAAGERVLEFRLPRELVEPIRAAE